MQTPYTAPPPAPSSALHRFTQEEAGGLATYEAHPLAGLAALRLFVRFVGIVGPSASDGIGTLLDALSDSAGKSKADRKKVMSKAASKAKVSIGGAKALPRLFLGALGNPDLPDFCRDVLSSATRNGFPMGDPGHFNLAYSADPISPIMAVVSLCRMNRFFSPPPMLRALIAAEGEEDEGEDVVE